MSKLLRQGFFRLRKNLVFYLCILFMIGFAILRLVTSYQMKVEYGYQIDIGEMLFSATLLLGIVASVFSGLFLGTEYSDGTMRNKLIVGHGRLSIYLSSLVVVTSAILVMFFSYFLVILGIGSILFGFTQVPIALLLLNSGSVVLLCLCYGALLTMLGMIVQNRAVGAVAAIIVCIVLLSAGAYCKARLSEPEYYDGYVFTSNEGTAAAQAQRNPNYLEGTKRERWQAALDINPAGQGFELMDFSAVYPIRLPFYSLAIAIMLTMLGIMIYRRRDSK